MAELDELKIWLQDLEAIADQHHAKQEPSVQRGLASISIQLDAMSVQRPIESETLGKVREVQTARVTSDMVNTLQDILGYYYLPEQPVGQNEPIIGSAIAVDLQRQLSRRRYDLFGIKDQIVQLLNLEGHKS